MSPPIRPPSNDPRDLQRAVAELCRKTDRDQLIVQSNTILVNETPNGKAIEVKPGGVAGGGKVEQFRVEAIHRDHLECKRVVSFDAVNGLPNVLGSIERIAKPDELRAFGWDNIGQGLIIGTGGFHYEYVAGGIEEATQNPYVERLATFLETSEWGIPDTSLVNMSEVVFPSYIAGRSIIYAAKVVQSPIITVTETETEVVDGIDTEVETDYPIEWIDLNTAGRAWQPKLRKLRVCIEGSTLPGFVLFRASNTFN